jgi:KaiC/GvpD/RAD55 family RecA-like ATPase
MQKAGVPLLLLCGAPGTGKSSVGWEIYFSLVREGVLVAHVDLDGIGYGPPDHFRSFDMKFQNVAALWRSYAEAGAAAFVVSGLRALRRDVEACAGAVPESLPTAIVLTVNAEQQQQRIVSRAKAQFALERGGASSSQTPDALEQFAAAAAHQLENEVENIPDALVVDTVDLTVPELARRILITTGWPAPTKSR